MTQRFGEDPDRRDFLHDIYQSEDIAANGLIRLAEKLGLIDENLLKYDLTHRAFGYAAFVAWSAQYASADEGVTRRIGIQLWTVSRCRSQTSTGILEKIWCT